MSAAMNITACHLKYIIVEEDYRFIRSDPALDTMQFPSQAKMQQRGGFMLHVSILCATVICIVSYSYPV